MTCYPCHRTMRKNALTRFHYHQQGIVLGFSLMLLSSVTLLGLTFFLLYKQKSQELERKGYEKQSYFIARAGAEDAIYEIKAGNTYWYAGHSALLANGWLGVSGQSFTYMKSYTDSHAAFDYSASYVVSVSNGSSYNSYLIESEGFRVQSHLPGVYRSKFQIEVENQSGSYVVVDGEPLL